MPPPSVGDLLHRSAARCPDKLAVVAGDLRVTYAEFDAAVDRTAHARTLNKPPIK